MPRPLGNKPVVVQPTVKPKAADAVQVAATPGAPQPAANVFVAGAALQPMVPQLPGAAQVPQATDDALFGVGAAKAKTRSSSESLGVLLDQVWAQRDQLRGRGDGAIYAMYNAVQEPNVLHEQPKAFAEGLAAIAQHRPAGSVSNLQGHGGGGDSITEWVKKSFGVFTGKAEKLDILSDFYRFERAGANFDEIKERVYVNAQADQAPALMRFVVQQIVDQPDRFPGVHMAKIAGPEAIGDRADSIVIYTSGGDATKQVLAALEKERGQHASEFMHTVPLMTQQEGGGVATGAEPAARYGGQMSFGSLRAEAIAEALQNVGPRASRGEFDAEVKKQLVLRSVDPDHPHLNLPEP